MLLRFLAPVLIATFVFGLSPDTFADHHKTDEGYVSLFDGKSLEGWDGDPKFWSVRDGAITGQTTSENKIVNGNTFLIWKGGEVADFELKLEYKISTEKGNSGIQYRSFTLPDNKDNKWRIGGYQADFEAGDRYSGICYGEKFRGILSDRGNITELSRKDGKFVKEVVGSVGDSKEIGSKVRKGEWNEYHIVARGNHMVHRINGVTTMELTDNDQQMRRFKGLLALQVHAGPPMTVQFKNIRVKHLTKHFATQQAKTEPTKKKVVFVAGTRSHGYGAHEHNAGCLLLAKHLQQALPNFECDVHQNGWPQNGLAAFDGADAVVVYCDGGGRHLLNDHIDEFNTIMANGVGLACLHYGVEVPKGKSGDAFLNWIGGYFETHWSVNPHWTAKYESFPDHPVSRGVEPFEINDEWYFHMRFREGMTGVTPILSAVAPDETMKRGDGPHSGNPHVRRAVAAKEPQHMAWVSENENGGRGFGFTGGHNHWNWGDDNFRKVVLNAICWIAKSDVPEGGVSTETPTRGDLEANQDFPKKTAKSKTTRRKEVLQSRVRPGRNPVTRQVAVKVEQDQSHDPGRAVANLDVHPELSASLFAAEPLMLSPSGIDVDHRGRVWVCEIVNYRDFANRDNPVREEGDRILILEDKDGDGVAESSTVFYQGQDINSPHGICVLGNKAIVSANGQVVTLIDTDGDDRADTKEVMYTGISGANHDHGIHAFVFGPDGKLYFNFGNAGKQLLTPDGKPVVDLAGNEVRDDRKPYQEGMVFRQNLDGSQFETLAWNFRNNWMVCVDSFGGIWQSDNDDDGNRGVRINYVMEFGNYGYKDEFTGAGWRTERTNSLELPQKHWHLNDPGVVPNLLHTGAGSPTGICVYEGSLLPTSLQGHLIHCDAGPSVTRAYVTSDDGAGYAAEIVNILEGTRDQWFRPTDVKVAPDGSLFVSDWYDPGVGGHRMGDVERGRVFRVVPKGHDGSYSVPKFDFSTAAGAVAALQNPNNSVRYHAWTALHGMGADAEPELLKLWEDSNNPRMRARALWLLAKIPGRGTHYVDIASRDKNKNIRCQSIRLARQLEETDVLPVVARLVKDPSPAVRRECAVALRHNKAEEAATLWTALANQHDGTDRWYLEALGIAADGQWDRFMAAWLESVDGKWKTPGGMDLIWRSRGSQTADWLAEVILNTDTTVAQLPRYFRAIDFLPEDSRKTLVGSLAVAKSEGTSARTKYVAKESIRRLGADSASGNPDLRAVIVATLDDVAGTREFTRLVSRFRMRDRYPDLLNMAIADPDGQTGVEAIIALLQNGQGTLIQQAITSGGTESTNAVIRALGNSGDNRVGELLAKVVASPSGDVEIRRNAVRAMAKSRAGVERLMKRVENKKLHEDLTAVAAAALNSSRWGDIRSKAAELFPLPPAKGAEPLPSLGELARQRGDVSNGQNVFANAGTCAKCHIVSGKGKEVGPNLTEIGSKLSREAMFEAILYPSAGISHNYEAYNLLTADGNQVTGLLTSKSDDEVVITSDDGITRSFKMEDVDLLEKQRISLMPADLQKLMTRQELIDVVEYLTTLKK